MSTELESVHTARTGPGAPGRLPLSRKRILETAIDFVDRRGLAALTMRRLGEEFGVEAMSLYRYVNGREDLLEGIVDQMVAQLQLRKHPNAFPLIATRHPAAPWLRPPLRSLRLVEDFLAMLTSRGFSDVRAVMAYRVFSSFLLGHLLLEASHLGAQASPAQEPLDEGKSEDSHANKSLDLDRFPHITRLEAELSEDRAAPEFEHALEDLLNRLNRLMTEQ